jgi:CYTH domain-containing protein
MPRETEHKYLVRKDLWYAIQKPAGVDIRQGYLLAGEGKTVRIRMAGPKAFLTIKGPSVNASRAEYEYPIPVTDATEMIALFAGPVIEKIRYKLDYHGKTWEIDEFFGKNEGLILAEIELQSTEETYDKPSWIGDDVTSDFRYYNAYLAEHPFLTWDNR